MIGDGEGYIVSVHRMVMENRPVDPGSIQASHRPIYSLQVTIKTNLLAELKHQAPN